MDQQQTVDNSKYVNPVLEMTRAELVNKFKITDKMLPKVIEEMLLVLVRQDIIKKWMVEDGSIELLEERNDIRNRLLELG